MNIERTFIPVRAPPGSLCWFGDALMDWTSGGIVHSLDGRSTDPCVRYAYRFDRAVMSPDGRYTVLYEVLGTKGLVLKDGKVLRELNRSFYHATAYEYPVALHTLPSGRTLLAHCPDEYCRIEIEDAETGQRLTQRTSDAPDFFHSRLQFSGNGRFLLSAGWIWHPVDSVLVFDVPRALEQPESLDDTRLLEPGEWSLELHSAAFGEQDSLVFYGSEPSRLGLYSLTERRLLSEVPVDRAVGTMMVMGEHVVSFFEHPSLIELKTGRTVERWPDLGTGTQCGSILHHLPKLPPLALDPAGRRFAVGTQKGIEVIRFIS
jgi:hypothetical protein